MISETTVLLWSLDNRETIEKIANSKINNVAVSVDAGELKDDIYNLLSGKGKRVLAKQFSTKESVEELCMLLDTTDVMIDCSSVMVTPGMEIDDLLLGLDPEVYNIKLLIGHGTFADIKKSSEGGFEDLTPIFIYHGPIDKILKSFTKEMLKYEAIALTFVEYLDRPLFYSHLQMLGAFTKEVVIWSPGSLDQLELSEPFIEEPVKIGHVIIECAKRTSVRIAPSFASRVDTELTVNPGDRFDELETRRPTGSQALFSRISINGKDRWVLKSNGSEEYFIETN